MKHVMMHSSLTAVIPWYNAAALCSCAYHNTFKGDITWI
jgi:hypothetical protein